MELVSIIFLLCINERNKYAFEDSNVYAQTRLKIRKIYTRFNEKKLQFNHLNEHE